MKRGYVAGGVLAGAVAASHDFAVPGIGPVNTGGISAVTTVASWGYDENCGRSGGRWVVGLGGSRVVACRPIRPSRDYEWHREGGREGWYQSREHHWHNDKW